MTDEAKTLDFHRIAKGQPAVSLNFGAARIDILGTAHVSAESSRVVTELMQTLDYDCVAVELCDQRLASLMGEVPDLDIWQVIRQQRLAELTTMMAMTAHQQRVAEQLDIEPGAEMKAAATQAEEQNIPLICIDRKVGVTLRRLSADLAWWKRATLIQLLIYNLFRRDRVSEEQIEGLKSNDQLQEIFGELMDDHEELYTNLVFERDRYMTNKIMQYLKEHRCSRMLVVVGAGHLRGMEYMFQRHGFPASRQQTEREQRILDHIPKRFKFGRIIPWLIVALILLGFAIGFDRGIGLSLVIDWVLINGGLAALGVFLAGGHVATIISGFIAAPLTSINPLIGAGMVTAAVQVTVSKPRVNELRTLRKDTATWAGWRRNRISRTLLVFALTTLGSLLGTYIGGIHIFSHISS